MAESRGTDRDDLVVVCLKDPVVVHFSVFGSGRL